MPGGEMTRLIDQPKAKTDRGGASGRWTSRLRRLVVVWSRCRHGVAASEFALIAPVLGFTLLASIDLGLAISERMAIDHVLRAGAQAAIPDPGEGGVLEVMRSTAQTNFALADESSQDGELSLTLSVSRYGACAEDVDFAVDPSTICAGSEPTFIYYRLTAKKSYTGWLAPDIEFERAAHVQIR